jgi:hypothetical protein
MLVQIEISHARGKFTNTHDLCVRGNVMFGENLVVTTLNNSAVSRNH